jgi:hypothetical protein
VRAVEITLAAPDTPLQYLRTVRQPRRRLIVESATARAAPGQRLLDETPEIRSKV